MHNEICVSIESFVAVGGSTYKKSSHIREAFCRIWICTKCLCGHAVEYELNLPGAR